MALHWGIIPVQSTEEETQDWRALCEHIASRARLARAGHTVLLVSGFNDDPIKNEPVLKILNL